MSYPTIGWETLGTHTADPRIPVPCPWCWGGGTIYERMDLGAPWELLPIRCPRCSGAGEVVIERRSGIR